MISALMLNGAPYLRTVTGGIARWLDAHGYTSLDEIRGLMSLERRADPRASPRAGYLQVLQGWTSAERRAVAGPSGLGDARLGDDEELAEDLRAEALEVGVREGVPAPARAVLLRLHVAGERRACARSAVRAATCSRAPRTRRGAGGTARLDRREPLAQLLVGPGAEPPRRIFSATPRRTWSAPDRSGGRDPDAEGRLPRPDRSGALHVRRGVAGEDLLRRLPRLVRRGAAQAVRDGRGAPSRPAPRRVRGAREQVAARTADRARLVSRLRRADEGARHVPGLGRLLERRPRALLLAGPRRAPRRHRDGRRRGLRSRFRPGARRSSSPGAPAGSRRAGTREDRPAARGS